MTDKEIVARLFLRAVRLAGSVCRNGLTGRSQDDLRKYAARLQRLSCNDPNDKFYRVLERANIKLIRFVSRIV